MDEITKEEEAIADEKIKAIKEKLGIDDEKEKVKPIVEEKVDPEKKKDKIEILQSIPPKDVPVLQPKQELESKQEQKGKLIKALDDAGINEVFIVDILKNILDNAEGATPTGEIIEDYQTKLNAIKTWKKLIDDSPDTVIQIANIFDGNDVL